MTPERIIGIDLGTTNSLVAYMENDRPVVIPGEDGLNLVPSVVALDERDQIIVGNAARKYLIETPERAVYSVKRLMVSSGRVRGQGEAAGICESRSPRQDLHAPGNLGLHLASA